MSEPRTYFLNQNEFLTFQKLQISNKVCSTNEKLGFVPVDFALEPNGPIDQLAASSETAVLSNSKNFFQNWMGWSVNNNIFLSLADKCFCEFRHLNLFRGPSEKKLNMKREKVFLPRAQGRFSASRAVRAEAGRRPTVRLFLASSSSPTTCIRSGGRAAPPLGRPPNCGRQRDSSNV